jgi:hypothetical protein
MITTATTSTKHTLSFCLASPLYAHSISQDFLRVSKVWPQLGNKVVFWTMAPSQHWTAWESKTLRELPKLRILKKKPNFSRIKASIRDDLQSH